MPVDVDRERDVLQDDCDDDDQVASPVVAEIFLVLPIEALLKAGDLVLEIDVSALAMLKFEPL